MGVDKLNNLDKLRKVIDECDREIVMAIEKRFNTVKQVVEYKKQNNLDIYQANREKEVLDKVDSYLNNKDFSQELKSLYIKIMDLSKEIQEKTY